MKILLAAVSSQSMADVLTEALSWQYTVVVCTDGQDALNALHTLRPDMMLVDLMLCGVDGVTVLQAAWDMGLRIPAVAISTYFSPYIVSALENLQVSSLIRLPCEAIHIAATLHSLQMYQSAETTEERRIRELLAMLGLSLNTTGYRASVTAIQLLLENPDRKFTGELYPLVAQLCKGTPTQVEKSIRHCIEAAWKKRNEQIWRIYFKVGKNGTVVKPTNADFLLRLVWQILQEKEDHFLPEKSYKAM